MESVNRQKQQELFYDQINQLECEYHLYFGLKSIQKGLSYIESIFDHFILDHETLDVSFKLESDLPQEIKQVIIDKHEEVFLRKQ